MTTVKQDREQTRIDGLLAELRVAEADWRRCYARVLDVVAELEQEKAGAATGFGSTARLLAGALNLSMGEARTRAEQAQLLAPRRSPTDGVPDQRSAARRNADALVEAMSSLLDKGELPTRGGQRPHLVLTMKFSDLLDGLGTAILDTGGRLSAAQARRLACDACVIPMVLSSDSMPVDIQNSSRQRP